MFLSHRFCLFILLPSFLCIPTTAEYSLGFSLCPRNGAMGFPECDRSWPLITCSCFVCLYVNKNKQISHPRYFISYSGFSVLLPQCVFICFA
jgi:hypothetical protein